MPLTEKSLKSKANFPTEKKSRDIADGGGLLARFFISGGITFYFRYRYAGKAAILKLGNYPEMSLKEARKQHKIAREKLEEGVDPRQSKVKTEYDRMTISDGFAYWHEHYLKANNKNAHNIMLIVKKHLLPRIGNDYFDDMTPQDWIAACKIELEVTSTVILSYAKQCSKYLLTLGLIKADTATVVRASYVGKKSKPRQRVLSLVELAKIYNMSERVDPTTRAATMILIFMGARSVEVRTISVGDVNEDFTIWTVPEEFSKTGAPLVRPIPDFMKPHFKYLIEHASSSGYCFTGWYESEMLRQSAFYERIRKAYKPCNIPNWSPHVLRHTLSTHFADIMIEPFIAERMLGHVMGGSMAVYNHGLYLAQQEKAMNTWHNAVNSVRFELAE